MLWDFDGRTWRMGSGWLEEFAAPRGDGRYDYVVTLEPHNRTWLFALESVARLPVRGRYTNDGMVVAAVPVRTRLRYDALGRLTTRKNATDAVQEAYLRALRYFGSLRGDDGRPWLLKIVRHACFELLDREHASAATESSAGKPKQPMSWSRKRPSTRQPQAFASPALLPSTACASSGRW